MLILCLQALNVVVRMEPTMKYPFNVRSFFTDRETKDIGGGLVLWRGYFQSVRPAIGQLLVNVDISTGTMYKSGPLLDLCLDFLGKPGQYNILSPRRNMPDRERIRLQRFITGIRIMTTYTGERVRKTPRVVKKLSSAGASDLSFSMRDGTTMTVAQYFQRLLNRPLRFPDNICIEVCISLLCFLVLMRCRSDLVHCYRSSSARFRLDRLCASRYPPRKQKMSSTLQPRNPRIVCKA